MTDQTIEPQPAALTAYLHVTAAHVSARTLRDTNSASVILGDDNASVAVLGSKAELVVVLNTALAAVERL